MTEYESLPEGWVTVTTATTAPIGYVVISNNESRFSGKRKIGIIKEDSLNQEKK